MCLVEAVCGSVCVCMFEVVCIEFGCVCVVALQFSVGVGIS